MPEKKCPHGRRKRACRDCKGSQICEHDKLKARCRDCGGSQICIHDKFKSTCRDCGGSVFCIHDKIKSECRDCGGSQICIHDKRKTRCRDCGGSALCKSSWCETYGRKKFEGYCMPCFVNNPLNADKLPSRNYKTKETDVVIHIRQTYPEFDWVSDKIIKDGCSTRRPDLLLDLGSHIIIIEIDENKHSDYDCSCENKRLMQLSQDLQHRPIVFIRFNPDSYKDVDGRHIRSCWKLTKGVMCIANRQEWADRLEALNAQVTYWVEFPSDKMVEIVQLFY